MKKNRKRSTVAGRDPIKDHRETVAKSADEEGTVFKRGNHLNEVICSGSVQKGYKKWKYG
jgi:hypothetical protein